MNLSQLERDLQAHEGSVMRNGRHVVYECGTGATAHAASGKLTIGYGRNLEQNGLTDDEARYLLKNDIHRCWREAAGFIPNWHMLNATRQSVIVEMVFQLGAAGVETFKRMIRGLQRGEYETASREMMDSHWAQQTPERAALLARRMRTGEIGE